jgi:polysaccharide export outer membrane protein
MAVWWVFLTLCGASGGCVGRQIVPPSSQLPVELDKVSMPAYVIEPPDILQIDAIKAVPLPPYRVEPLDQLYIRVDGADPNSPIEGVFPVDPDGTVNLIGERRAEPPTIPGTPPTYKPGIRYGKVRIAGMTLEEAQKTIDKYLLDSQGFKTARSVVALAATARAVQEVRGEHLVRPDGTIALGRFGSVYVTGLTIADAKKEVEKFLSQFLLDPEISLDVLAYNSKVFYIITDGGGFGQQVARLPITGNETVLDAMSNLGGLPPQASKRHIWIARPTPPKKGEKRCSSQILPVDWVAIVECGRTETNYQVLPGDRIYVQAEAVQVATNLMNKIVAPIERLFGVTLLGNETVRAFARGGGVNNTTNRGF